MGARRKTVFALIPTLLLLGILAIGFVGEPENDPWLNASPLWGPGDPFYVDDPAKTHSLADPVLIWRGRPHYEAVYTYLVPNPYKHNAYGLRDDELVDPKPAGTVRVVNVGDSSTWGLNLPEREATYTDQLQRLLDERVNERWDIVNGGVVGYSSFQTLQLVRHWLDDLEPDVVTVYAGNNDPGPAVVGDVARVAATSGRLHGALYRNRFYLLLVKGLQHLRAARIERERETLGERAEHESKAGFYRAGVRVSPDEHEANLRALVAFVREAGRRPILLKVPMNLVWPQRVQPYVEQVLRPDRFWGTVKIELGYLVRQRAGKDPCFHRPLPGHPYLCLVTRRDLERAGLPDPEALARQAADPERSERDRLWAVHNGAVWRFAEGDVAGALAGFEGVAAGAEACDCVEPKHLSWVHHNLGIARLLLGRQEEAFDALVRSRRTWPFAMSPDYGERFDRVVAELDVESVDLQRAFREVDPAFFGSALIHDWVHPNAQGNAVIARALADKLEPR